MSDDFDQVVGQQPSGVAFLADSVQLQFNSLSVINIYDPATFFSHGEFVRSGDDQFRNRLCEQIRKTVKSVFVIPGVALKMTFQDDSVIGASLTRSDWVDPRMVFLQGLEDE